MFSSRVTFGVLASLVASCSDKVSSTSTPKHDNGKPVRSELKSNWVELSRDQFLEKVLKTDSKTTFDSNHPMTQRLQGWTDRFDAYLRTVDPKGMMSVPKPNVLVLNSIEKNAFVASVPVCYDISTSVGGGGTRVPAVLFYKKDESAIALNEGQGSLLSGCIPGDNAELVSIIKEYEATDPACRVTVKDGKVEFGSRCKGNREDGTPLANMSSDRLVVFKIPNWFVVLSAIFEIMKDEASMIGVVAHELGHYYRSHGLALPKQYDFYYRLSASGNNPSKPKADPNLQAIGLTTFNASALFDSTSRIPKGEGYEVSPFHYLAVGDLALQAQSKGLSSVSCKELGTYNTDVAKATKLKGLPFGKATTAEDYRAVVKLGQDCLTDIDSAKLSLDLERAYQNPSFAPFKIVPDIAASKRQLQTLSKGIRAIGFVAKSAKISLSSTTFSQKIFIDMEAAHIGVDREIREILANAYKSGLGQYTTEQEADDFSVELLHGTKVGGLAAVNAYISLLPEESRFGGFDLSRERCQEIFANKWTDPKGEFLVNLMPIGNYSENHHGTCFRAFNADREIKAHGYSAKGSVSFSGAEWAGLTSTVGQDGRSMSVFQRGSRFGLGMDSCHFERPQH